MDIDVSTMLQEILSVVSLTGLEVTPEAVTAVLGAAGALATWWSRRVVILRVLVWIALPLTLTLAYLHKRRLDAAAARRYEVETMVAAALARAQMPQPEWPRMPQPEWRPDGTCAQCHGHQDQPGWVCSACAAKSQAFAT